VLSYTLHARTTKLILCLMLLQARKLGKIFSDTYASSDVSNVMKLEERFGAAKETAGMPMSQWFSHIRDLASRLREVGTILPSERVANRMLNGLGPEWDNVKWALKVRSGRLTVELGDKFSLDRCMVLLQQQCPLRLRTITNILVLYVLLPQHRVIDLTHTVDRTPHVLSANNWVVIKMLAGSNIQN